MFLTVTVDCWCSGVFVVSHSSKGWWLLISAASSVNRKKWEKKHLRLKLSEMKDYSCRSTLWLHQAEIHIFASKTLSPYPGDPQFFKLPSWQLSTQPFQLNMKKKSKTHMHQRLTWVAVYINTKPWRKKDKFTLRLHTSNANPSNTLDK